MSLMKSRCGELSMGDSGHQILRLAQISNASDASSRELLDSALAIIAIFTLGFSTAQIGVLDFLESSAFMFLALPMGLLVDRHNPIRILTLSLVAKIVLSSALCVGMLAGLTNPVFFMVLVFCLGVAVVASENSQTSLIPFITHEDTKIESGISRMSAADSVAGVVAPAAAELEATILGPPSLPALARFAS